MSENYESTETGGLGERRRRREAARAAERAAELAGEPLTRKELRRRQLEEEARREAIATGELQLRDERGNAMTVEQSATRAATAAGTGDGAQPPLRRRERRPAPVAEMAPGDTTTPVAEVAPGDTAAPVAEVAPGDTAAPVAEVAPGDTAAPVKKSPPPVPANDSRPAALTRPDVSSGATAEPTRVTRRPVVRAPHAAKGMRSLDATGTLTGIQPVPAAAPPSSLPAPDAPTDPTEWESAVHLPVISEERPVTDSDERTFTVPDEPAFAVPAEPELEQTVAMSPIRDATAPHRMAPATPALPRGALAQPTADVEHWAGADSSDAVLEDDEYDDEPPRPQWTTLAEYSAATGASPDVAAGTSPDEAGEAVGRRSQRDAERRPLRARVTETARAVGGASAHSPDGAYEDGAYDEDDDYEEEPENPATSVIKIVILVFAAIVIGLLIGLLAFGGGAEDGAAGLVPTLLAYLGTPGGTASFA
ncbi:hypothetical protein FE374_11820 [Georgenia yuyongxinii]|uniref:Uncharacterized protein n=1 Tax=Georgenia yuyongxinii TaxID=2589797 RepID=A0A5B8C702_9MICO|nr:hypothetical protein [Georgenia yuyongxinii]QDC25201.1 hypothetical protein FE374_11820 [Georgenia yuyongxinii]